MSETELIIISSGEETDTEVFPEKQETISTTEGSQIGYKYETIYAAETDINKSGMRVSNGKKEPQATDNPVTSSSGDSILPTIVPNTHQEKALLKKIETSCINVVTIDEESNIQDCLKNEEKKCDVFNQFLSKVLLMEKNKDDRIKLEKKINKHYNYIEKEYVTSSEFYSFLENCLTKLDKDPQTLYFVIKEVLDWLDSKRVFSIHKYKNSDVGCSNQKSNMSTDEDIYFIAKEKKDHKIVKRLSRMLDKLNKRIKELEEEEVDFSDEENSATIKAARYKKRFIKVFNKLCSYSEASVPVKRLTCRRKVDFCESQDVNLQRLNQAVQKWLHKKNIFPDYYDIQQLVKEQNEVLSLELTKDRIDKLARTIFIDVGQSMQRHRKYELWNSLSEYLENTSDPAADNPNLQKVLETNYEIGQRKELELIDYYAQQDEKDNIISDEGFTDDSPTENRKKNKTEINEDEKRYESAIATGDNENKNCDKSNSENHTKAEATESKSLTKASSPEHEFQDKELNKTKVTESVPNPRAVVKQPLCLLLTSVPASSLGRDGEITNEIPMLSCVWTSDYIKREGIIMENRKGRTKSWSVSEETVCSKKPKFDENQDSDSDVVILSDDEDIEEKKDKTRNNSYHVNYAFINSNINHSFLFENFFFNNRTLLDGKVKSRKFPRRFTRLRPFKDITNTKEKKVGFCKFNTANRWTAKCNFTRLGLKRPKIYFSGKYSFNCALDNNNDGKKIGGSNGSDRGDENCGEKNTSDETMESSAGRGLGSGNGQDNNENNDDKKHADQGKEIEDLQESEDQEDNENGEEEKEISNGNKDDSQYCDNKGSDEQKIECCSDLDGSDPCAITNYKMEYLTSKEYDYLQHPTDFLAINMEEEIRHGVDDIEQNNMCKIKQKKLKTEDINEHLSSKGNERKCKFKTRKLSASFSNHQVTSVRKMYGETNHVIQDEVDIEKHKRIRHSGKNIKSVEMKVKSERGANNINKMDIDDANDVPYIISEKLNTQTKVNRKLNTPSKSNLPPNQTSFKWKISDTVKPDGHQLGTFRKQRQIDYTLNSSPGTSENFKALKRRLYPDFKKCNPPEIRCEKPKQSKVSRSDEEIVKNFLQHSPSSISITRTKKATTLNKPSSSVLQALETLSRLKGISTTIVKGSSKKKDDEDITVIEESLTPRVKNVGSFRPSSDSLINNVQSDDYTIPKIVTVQGNVSGFENMKSCGNDSTLLQKKVYYKRRRSLDSVSGCVGNSTQRNNRIMIQNGNTQSSPQCQIVQPQPRTSVIQEDVEYVELD